MLHDFIKMLKQFLKLQKERELKIGLLFSNIFHKYVLNTLHDLFTDLQGNCSTYTKILRQNAQQ